MQVIGYARVSSKEQAEGRSIENQVKLLKAAGCDDVLVDIESAYSKRDRPNFNKLMSMVKGGLVSKVIVCTLDRLSRNETVTFIAFDDFEKAGCQLISLEENFNLQSPEGRLQAGFAALMARNYSAQLSQKTKRGHKARRDRNAAYFKCFGYKIQNEKYYLDHEPFLCLLGDRIELSKAAIASDILAIFKSCKSLRRTLHILNSKYGLATFSRKGKGNKQLRDRFGFSVSGLYAWISNPILRGHIAYGRSQRQRQEHRQSWDIRYDTHPDQRLITDADYSEIDDIFNWNRLHHGFNNEPKLIHPLSGLVFCAECGRSHRITGSLQRDKITKFYYYQCQNYTVRACSQKKSIRDTAVETEVISKLIQAAELIANIAEVDFVEVDSLELRELRSQLATLQTMGANPAIAQAITQIKNQIIELERSSCSGRVQNEVLRSVLVESFSNPLYFETLLEQDKKAIYRALIDRVLIIDGVVIEVILRV